MKTTKDIMSQMHQSAEFVLRQSHIDSGQKRQVLRQLIDTTRQQLEELVDYLARTDGDNLEYATAVCACDDLAGIKEYMSLEELIVRMNMVMEE